MSEQNTSAASAAISAAGTAKKADAKKGGLTERLKGIKHKEIILACIAVGVMLIIYFSTFLSKPSAAKNADTQTTGDYCAAIKAQIEKAVNSMTGKDDATVLISWESGVESVIAYVTNESANSSSSSPQIVQGGPIVLKEVYPKALGVVVLCYNGTNARTQLEIKDMVSTLLEIEPAKIAVYKTGS